MRVAFHFDEDALGNGDIATERIMRIVHDLGLPIRSRVSIGSLLIHTGAEIETRQGQIRTRKTDKDVLVHLMNQWLQPQAFCWYALTPRAKEVLCERTLHCNLYETIEPRHALAIHKTTLREMPEVYLGALEIDERLAAHLCGYRLVPYFRLHDTQGYANWDGIDEDSKRPWVIEMLERAGFDPVEHENVSARYTIFDRHSGAKATQTIAKCRGSMVELLDGVIDASLIRIGEAMPDVHERLWSILNAYETAEMDEQLAHVALGCRRLIEYAADMLYPAHETKPGERKLDQAAFKNRLLKYLEEHQVSKVDQDVVSASIDHVAASVDRLLELVNKGVHGSIQREQARRCILGVVLLLDDMCSVSRDGFMMCVSLNTDLVKRVVGGGRQDNQSHDGSSDE